MPPARLERATHSLEGCCSIQLSYESIKERIEILTIEKLQVKLAGKLSKTET